MSAEEFLQFADSLTVPLLLVSGDGMLLAANREAGRRLNLAPSHLENRPLNEIVTNSEAALKDYLFSCSRTREPVTGALEFRTDDGSLLPCRCEGAAVVPRTEQSPALIQMRMKPKSDSPSQFALLTEQVNALTKEIAERKRVEEALHIRQSEIEALNIRLQRAMEETHHRIKNNLQIIVALVEMQRSQYPDAVPVHELDRIAQHVRSLSAIHNLLTDELGSRPDVEHLSVSETLFRLLPMLQDIAGERSLNYDITDFHISVRQASALAVVINELVNNAVKHGTGEITLVLKIVEEQARLEICDHGPGFPSDFNAGAKAHTGLELVEELGHWDLEGQTSYTTLLEGGACVRVTFPLKAEPHAHS